MTKYSAFIILLFSLLIVSCGGSSSSSKTSTPTDNDPAPVYTTLKQAAEANTDIYVGALYNDYHMQFSSSASTYRDMLKNHFNMMSFEYSIEASEIWTDKNTIDFTRPDIGFEYAKENNMAVRVTHLLWHSAVPAWLSSGSYTDTQVENLVKWYIQTMITRYMSMYPDMVIDWNVVNEPVSDTEGLRNTFYYQKLGSDYIAKAFQWSREASPTARLFINDYGIVGASTWNNTKKATMMSIINDLQTRAIDIDGIGFQGHFTISDYNTDEINAIRSDFAEFASLGLILEFTELDILINDDQLGITEEKLKAQSDFYYDIYDLCLQTPECEAVSLWGLSDNLSYVNTSTHTWPVQTVDWPLIIDGDLQTKTVYDRILQMLSEQ
jgi:endo-1,4-beta-xylanase